MLRLLTSNLMNSVAFAPEGEGAGGGDAAATAAAAAVAASEIETVLYAEGEKPPAETKPEGEVKAEEVDPNAPAGDDKAGKKEGEEGEDAPKWEEYKPDETKTDEENAALKEEHDKTKPADEFVIPEAYELTMPEGIELDSELLEAVTPVFKDLMLTNDQAQALTDKFVEHMAGQNKATVEAWAETLDGWVETAKKDPELGGSKGEKWGSTVENAQLAINKLGTPELKAYLQRSGGGNHPELIRVFAKIGPLLKQDDPAHGGDLGGGKPVEVENVLFPNG